ncbi:MAG TPA: hypothetical protein VHF69_15020, partial [Candidatus Synoicihabitans sp.]|nr:hypothetical protein [Candidatus Synoicihabitans sp.]
MNKLSSVLLVVLCALTHLHLHGATPTPPPTDAQSGDTLMYETWRRSYAKLGVGHNSLRDPTSTLKSGITRGS